MPVDLLAIAAHRDDVELTCAGTLIRAADLGHRTGILDLTQGETGTRGSATLRGEEAARAAQVLGVVERRNAGLPDAHLHNTEDARRAVVAELRHFRPRVVILPYPVGRHPDHRIASELARDACFLAGLAKYDAPGEPHRPFKILYSLAYREDPVKPTFVVDISAQMARKMEAIRCYASQFDGAHSAGEIFPTGQDLYSLVETQSAHYGSLIRTRFGEPFFTHETVQVDDVVGLEVQSM
ncbi:MAG TPA: bacillithiol biosynthesis deacetylase BshB1 [Gemmatimonadales bacterium]|nr:bacillithiol biosynthesis deacetylase BshB1 [Gemmatimonadales bacterium]